MSNQAKAPDAAAANQAAQPSLASAAPTPGGGLASTTAGGPAVGGGVLQDLLPEVQALARKCGGLDKLAEIVDSLRTAKPV